MTSYSTPVASTSFPVSTLVDRILCEFSLTMKLAALFDAICIFIGSIIVGLAAQVEVPLGFTPVPVTGQTFGVLVVGMALGARRGAIALMLYLAEGAAGVPVFAGGGAGIVHLVGPTGGYLFGFVLAASIAGFLAQRGWDRNIVWTALAMTIGTAFIFALGLLYLAQFELPTGVLAAGLYPFLPGAVVKIIVAAGVMPAVWKIVNRDAKTSTSTNT